VNLGEARAGFFSQLPYLMVYARGTQSYGILRGVHINHDVLCARVLPPSAVPDLEVPMEGQTSRELMEVTTTPCGNGCHDNYINPLGFAFENFDGLGRLRDTDNGQPVDTKAAYPFTGGKREFDGAPELMSIIAGNDMAHECYAAHVAGFALQRELAATDRSLIDELSASSLGGASVRELFLALVTSPAFHTPARTNP
jgi:hypothetical protein